jgi:hypothetical protein
MLSIFNKTQNLTPKTLTTVSPAVVKSTATETFVLVPDEPREEEKLSSDPGTGSLSNQNKMFSGKSIMFGVPRLPQLITTMKVRHVFRYYCGTTTGTSSGLWKFGHLYNALGVATSSTLSFGLIGSWKLRKITAYYPNNASTTSSSDFFTLYWAASIPLGTADVSMAPSEMGSLGSKLSLVPPKKSTLSMWQNGQSAAAASNCFIVISTQGVVLDIDMEFTMVDLQYTSSSSTGTGLNSGFGTSAVPNSSWTPVGYQPTIY